MTKAPALFIGHGSPMNAIEDTPASRGWRALAQRFAKPRAILCISAHWVADGVRVMSNAQPRTIHDFGRSFPQALFDVQYPAPGDPEVAERAAKLLAPFDAKLDDSWGLDHGAWSVLKWLYPNADVPIVQVSLDRNRAPRDHHAIGEALAPLRDENIAIIGTGNIVHNLRAFFSGEATPWAQSFEDFILARVAAGDHAAVGEYQHHPDAPRAAPDWDHFTPLIAVLGARDPGERGEAFNRELGPGISMTSIGFGLQPAAALSA